MKIATLKSRIKICRINLKSYISQGNGNSETKHGNYETNFNYDKRADFFFFINLKV